MIHSDGKPTVSSVHGSAKRRQRPTVDALYSEIVVYLGERGKGKSDRDAVRVVSR